MEKLVAVSFSSASSARSRGKQNQLRGHSFEGAKKLSENSAVCEVGDCLGQVLVVVRQSSKDRADSRPRGCGVSSASGKRPHRSSTRLARGLDLINRAIKGSSGHKAK